VVVHAVALAAVAVADSAVVQAGAEVALAAVVDSAVVQAEAVKDLEAVLAEDLAGAKEVREGSAEQVQGVLAKGGAPTDSAALEPDEVPADLAELAQNLVPLAVLVEPVALVERLGIGVTAVLGRSAASAASAVLVDLALRGGMQVRSIIQAVVNWTVFWVYPVTAECIVSVAAHERTATFHPSCPLVATSM